jgi:GT2 family glycosyltransferase
MTLRPIVVDRDAFVSSMVELSIIVVSWNAKSYVQECLTSLSQQSLNVSIEIIVVDNASSDGTPEMVQQQFPHMILIRNSENLGFAKANNIGLRVAKGRYLCLINSDVNVPPECLQTIHDFMEQNPAVGVAGPRMLTTDGLVSRSYMRFPTLWNSFCNALSLDSVFKGSHLFGGVLMSDFDNKKTSEVDVLNGWFLVVRREAADLVGFLDESFFMYGEDIDWSYRFHHAGWGRVYFAGASALHYGGASSKAASTRFYIQMHRANLQYWKKHYSRVGVLGYWLTTLVHHALRTMAYSLVYLFTRGRKLEASFKMKRSAFCIAWLMGLRSEWS